MLLKVVDGEGNAQTIIVAGQETVVESDGEIEDPAAGTQVVLAENASRSGWFFKNLGASSMFLNELGDATADSFEVAPGETFPPAGYPLSTGDLKVLGTIGELFVAREW